MGRGGLSFRSKHILSTSTKFGWLLLLSHSGLVVPNRTLNLNPNTDHHHLTLIILHARIDTTFVVGAAIDGFGDERKVLSKYNGILLLLLHRVWMFRS